MASFCDWRLASDINTRLYPSWRLQRSRVPPARTKFASGAERHLNIFKDQTRHTLTASAQGLSGPLTWPWFCFSREGLFDSEHLTWKSQRFPQWEARLGRKGGSDGSSGRAEPVRRPEEMHFGLMLCSLSGGKWVGSHASSCGQEKGLTHETEMDKDLLLPELLSDTTTCPKGACSPRQASLPTPWTEGHSVSFASFT